MANLVCLYYEKLSEPSIVYSTWFSLFSVVQLRGQRHVDAPIINDLGAEAEARRVCVAERLLTSEETERLTETTRTHAHTKAFDNEDRGFFHKFFLKTSMYIVVGKRGGIVEEDCFWNNADSAVNKYVNIGI